MIWLIAGVIIGLVLVIVPFPWNLGIGFGILFAVLMRLAEVLEGIAIHLKAMERPKPYVPLRDRDNAPDGDPDAPDPRRPD